MADDERTPPGGVGHVVASEPDSTTTPAVTYAVTGDYNKADLSTSGKVAETPLVDRDGPDPVESTEGQTPMGTGACSLHADQPDIAWRATTTSSTKGIWFDADMQCAGSYLFHSTCVKLQERDSTGAWYQRTKFRCGELVTGPRSHAGGWVSCANAKKGFFRTKAKGIVNTASDGTLYAGDVSIGANLCG